MKVLLVKTSSMGDVIHTFPALTDALAMRPDLEIDWCVEEPFVDLVRLHPGVGHIYPVAVRRWRKSVFAPSTRKQIAAFRRTIRAKKYDLVIDAQGLMKSALLARLAGAPIAGLDRSSIREPMASLFYAARHTVAKELHAIDRTRILLGKALDYEPHLASLSYGLLAQPAGRTSERGVFLLHGTSWPSKHWHQAGWIDLARLLIDDGFRPIVTYATEAEQAASEEIARAVPDTRLVPKTSLAEVADIMSHCVAAVGTDTGLTHLACAFDLPTVQISLSTVPGLTGPRGGRVDTVTADIDCAPCRKRDCPLVPKGQMQPCAQTVSAAEVMRRLQMLMRRGHE